MIALKRNRLGIILASCARHGFLAIMCIIMVAPFAVMTSASLKSSSEIMGGGLSFLPQDGWFALENYGRVLTEVPILRYMLNGLFVTGSILFMQLLIGIPAGYALAKLQFRGKNLIFGGVLLGIMVPAQVTALPIYIMLYLMGLTNTYASLILPFIVSAFGIFLFRQFFRGISDDLLNAARVDGLGETEIIWRIVVPIARPAIIAFGIFSIVAHWNDLFWPLVAISDSDLAPPPLGILFFRNQEAGDDFGALMAAAVIVTTPLILVFLLAQKHFVQGIAMSSQHKPQQE